MEDVEQISFEIISNTGEARSLLMNIIAKADQGDFTNFEQDFKTANDRLKDAQKVHLKAISSAASDKNEGTNLLLVHAEDQMMAAELVRDLTQYIVHINQELVELKKK